MECLYFDYFYTRFRLELKRNGEDYGTKTEHLNMECIFETWVGVMNTLLYGY